MIEALLAKGVGDFAGGLGKSLGSAFGGDSGPFLGGAAESATYGTALDGSGWIVNLGGQQIASSTPTRTTPDYMTPAPAQASMLLPLLVFGGAAAFYFLRKRRK